jgi:uncharacterized protein (DUF433 family)
MAEGMSTFDRITIRPEVCLGQPAIRDTRITLGVILRLLAAGRSIDDVLQAYPALEADDVRQAMAYAAWAVSDQHRVVTLA